METWTNSLAARQFACNELLRFDSCFVHYFCCCCSWSEPNENVFQFVVNIIFDNNLAASNHSVGCCKCSCHNCCCCCVCLQFICSQFKVQSIFQLASWQHLQQQQKQLQQLPDSAPELTSSPATSARMFVVCLCIFLEEPGNFPVELASRFSLLFVLHAPPCAFIPQLPPAIFLFFTLAFLLCFSLSLCLSLTY